MSTEQPNAISDATETSLQPAFTSATADDQAETILPANVSSTQDSTTNKVRYRTSTPRRSNGHRSSSESVPQVISPANVSPSAPTQKRARKHQHSVSFGSPLAQQITNTESIPTATTRSPPLSPSNTRRQHHRQASSTSSTSAQHLTLIQQRYAAEQHAEQERLLFQQQLANKNSPRRHRSASYGTGFHQQYPGSLSDFDQPNDAHDKSSQDSFQYQRFSRAQSDIAQQLQIAQALHQLHLQQQQLQQQQESLLPHQFQNVQLDTPSLHYVNQLRPSDIQQTNNALAQQLAMLTLMNDLGSKDSQMIPSLQNPVNQSHYQNATNRELGSTEAINVPREAGNTGLESVRAAESSNSTSSPRTDPLHNPNNTSNVYINNLPAAFTETHLYQLCTGFGPISSVRMMLRDSGTCYGFVLFESMEAAENCILWLRQFSDVHPSFARTPLKSVRQSLSPVKPSISASLASPLQISPEPSISAQEPQRNHPAAPVPQHVSQHTSSPGLQVHQSFSPTKAQHGEVHGNLGKPTTSNDVRIVTGRVGSLGVNQLFPQRDPAAINAVVNATKATPFSTPADYTPRSTATLGAGPAEVPGPNLLIDGLPSNIDLPNLESLFAPHRVVSTRFFRPAATKGSDAIDSSRVVALVRLPSFGAAEESIDRLHDRVVPGWTAPGTKLKVCYADHDPQNQLSLSEQRLQRLLSQKSDIAGSPLDRKPNVQLQYGSPIPSPFSNFSLPHMNSQNHQQTPSPGEPIADLVNQVMTKASAALPAQNSPGNYIINVPHQRQPLFAQPRSQILSPSMPLANNMGTANAQVSRLVPNSPAQLPRIQSSYRVPNNTPAKQPSAVPQSPLSSPRYVVQLPANYLQQRSSIPVPDFIPDTVTIGGQESGTILSPKFTMPSPALFKPALKSAPLVIRAPPPLTTEGPQVDIANTPLAAVNAPSKRENPAIEEDGIAVLSPDALSLSSPITSIGTATPATTGGPFTPFLASSSFSPMQEKGPIDGDLVFGKHERVAQASDVVIGEQQHTEGLGVHLGET